MDLADKLGLGEHFSPTGSALDLAGIAAQLGGQVQRTPWGSYILKEAVYPLDYAHGNRRLGVLLGYHGHGVGFLDSSFDQLDLERLVFFDTETTGLGRGSGTYIFLMGLVTSPLRGSRSVSISSRIILRSWPAFGPLCRSRREGYFRLFQWQGLRSSLVGNPPDLPAASPATCPQDAHRSFASGPPALAGLPGQLQPCFPGGQHLGIKKDRRCARLSDP